MGVLDPSGRRNGYEGDADMAEDGGKVTVWGRVFYR